MGAGRDARRRSARRSWTTIGAVNVDAIAEYDALEERHHFLETQHADLVAAKNELLDIIAQINATSRTLFAETFERIRINFQEMFAELFGGGKANLLLTNEEDPLECGIDIIARPPGKQLQSVTLLSGGEKTMTAVALLFAIYMVKPSPFCVLDEMDAPLDESNISRFLKILDRFVSQSQFIVITHNKRTIARADVLYGITMEEAGVSKLVAVRMARARPRVSRTRPGHERTGHQRWRILEETTTQEAMSIAETFGKSGNLHSEKSTATDRARRRAPSNDEPRGNLPLKLPPRARVPCGLLRRPIFPGSPVSASILTRLAQVIVHARRQAPFAVAFERVGRQGDDGRVHPVCAFSRWRISRVAVKPSISGIWQSMSITS